MIVGSTQPTIRGRTETWRQNNFLNQVFRIRNVHRKPNDLYRTIPLKSILKYTIIRGKSRGLFYQAEVDFGLFSPASSTPNSSRKTRRSSLMSFMNDFTFPFRQIAERLIDPSCNEPGRGIFEMSSDRVIVGLNRPFAVGHGGNI